MNALENIVMFFVLVVSLLVWAIIGLIFWIPLLLRTTIMLLAVIFHAAITRQDPFMMMNSLEAAASFYFNGFKNAINTIKNEAPDSAATIKIKFSVIVIEILWTALMWLVILILFHFIPAVSFLEWTLLTTAEELEPMFNIIKGRVNY